MPVGYSATVQRSLLMRYAPSTVLKPAGYLIRRASRPIPRLIRYWRHVPPGFRWPDSPALAALAPSWPLVTIADRIVNHAGNLAALRPGAGTIMPTSPYQRLPQEDDPRAGPSDTSAHPAFAAAWSTRYHIRATRWSRFASTVPFSVVMVHAFRAPSTGGGPPDRPR